ncbi:MAG: acyl-CoA desaturase, partial [Nocardioidaceae bacterium]
MTIDIALRPAPSPRSGQGSDFARLRARVEAAGLLERRPAYYVLRIGVVAASLVLGWTAFFVVGSSWLQILVAALLAVVFAQVALVA